MAVHFLASELARWDESDNETLLLTFFADERPLRGAAGLADWRLGGLLSRLIRKGKISGKMGETLMLPPGRRLPFKRIMVFGLGDSRSFNEGKFRDYVKWIRDVSEKAGVSNYAVQVPGRATGLIGARRALELWLDVCGDKILEGDASDEESVSGAGEDGGKSNRSAKNGGGTGANAKKAKEIDGATGEHDGEGRRKDDDRESVEGATVKAKAANVSGETGKLPSTGTRIERRSRKREISLIDSQGGQKDMAEFLRHRARHRR